MFHCVSLRARGLELHELLEVYCSGFSGGHQAKRLGTDDTSTLFKGCLPKLQLPAWGFKAFVLKKEYRRPSPVITKFLPGHDHRLLSTSSIPIEFRFSIPMDCQQISRTLKISSTNSNGQFATLDSNSIRCENVSHSDDVVSAYSGTVTTSWSFKATLMNVSDGIYQVSLHNISTAADRKTITNSHDHFLLRVGRVDNPMVFASANYSSDMLFEDKNHHRYISHKAAGADMFRYSLNFGTTYTNWEEYPRGEKPTSLLAPKVWSGTRLQDWKGEHIIVQYWSRLTGSSNHIQQADLAIGPSRRHFPQVFLEGEFNQHGFDQGFPNRMQLSSNNTWGFDFVHEWPAQVALNIWGINPEYVFPKLEFPAFLESCNVVCDCVLSLKGILLTYII